jgi:hypothetical protein
MVDDGALFTVKKTDINDAVTTLEYKMVGGEPVLQSGKGNEVIEVDENNNVVVKGDVQYTKTGEANSLKISYVKNKNTQWNYNCKSRSYFRHYYHDPFLHTE